MITVADILALPAFDNVELIVPCENAGSRAVHNVGILDCPPDYNRYSVYYPGELIVTNLGFANGDAKLAEESLVAMIERGVSAIAIKTVYDPPITERMRKASRESNVPVYLYEGSFHEMVAYQALDLIRRDEHESDRNEAIDGLLAGVSGETVRSAVYGIAGVTGAAMQCFAVMPRKGDESSLYAVMGSVKAAVDAIASRFDEVESGFVCRYHHAVLVFLSYASRSGESDAACALEREIEAAGSLCCGAGTRMPLCEGDLAIRQALACLREGADRGLSVLNWRDMGKTAFSEAASCDRMFSDVAEMYRAMLRDYDEENDAELLSTAKTLAEEFGDVKSTADALYQHPNTVRYRIKRIKAVLGMDDASDRELVVFLSLVFLA